MDERFPHCRAFAAELHRAGVFTSGISGDVADLWYGDLRAHLRENRAPIAGLTDRLALFCLEELARDVGMRVTFRADHILDRNDPPDADFGRTITNRLTRSASRRSRARAHRAILSGKQNNSGLVAYRLRGISKWSYRRM